MEDSIDPTPTKMLSAIGKANDEGLVAHERSERALQILHGYSGKKLIGALQRLCRLFPSDGSACYLEIGVFQGLTLNHVAAANPGFPVYGIDNFAFFDHEKKNLGIVTNCIEQLNNDNASLINADYEDALDDLGSWIGDKKVAVYFVDGPHDYRSQLMCLELALPYLHERAVAIVDDSNYEHVRQANADFLRTHKDWALLAEAYTPAHPKNLSPREAASAQAGWWNGVNILGRDPTGLLPRRYPQTSRDRAVFEADHTIHAHRMAQHAVRLLRIWGYAANFAPLRAGRELFQLLRSSPLASPRRARFDEMNTYTEDLVPFASAQFFQDGREPA